MNSIPQYIFIFNILLVDDTWANLMALKNNLDKVKIEGIRIVTKTCIDGEKAV